jgi:hypothetical protein
MTRRGAAPISNVGRASSLREGMVADYDLRHEIFFPLTKRHILDNWVYDFYR